MDSLNKIIANLIAAAAGNANVIAAQKQLVNVSTIIGSTYDPSTVAAEGATVAGQVTGVKNLMEGSLIVEPAAKESLKEAYSLLVTATTTIPT